MERRGLKMFAYLDDLLILSKGKTDCWLALNELVNLLCSLGLCINWDKTIPPTQSLVYLGVQINTVDRSLSLPREKVAELLSDISLWKHKKRVSKKDIQRICGKLNWAARVIRGGRTYLRRLIDLSMKLKNDKHRTWLNKEAKADLFWWESALLAFNGLSPFVADIPAPDMNLATDACLEGGAGFYNGDFFYTNFMADAPIVAKEHISCKEIYTILLACRRWGHLWFNSHMLIFCDNTPSVHALNKGTSRNTFFMKCIREIHRLGVKFNFRITAQHIPGKDNTICDTLSRLHDPMFFNKASVFLAKTYPFSVFPAYKVMSFRSFVCLQDCIRACRVS